MKCYLSKIQTVLLAFCVTIPSARIVAQATNTNAPAQTLQPGQMPYFDVVPDPIEGVNRGVWAFNDWLFRGFFYPVSFGYNAVV
ncbi:MAG TPA: MlaA family lipoprotein, partial [Candidatus Cybelea sp.]|nr:MlaA family lipoprotein [Candidatus Cybelea sp.]